MGKGKQLYYKIMWEREVSLGDHIQHAWEGEQTKGDLGVISGALKNMLKSLK